LGDFEKYFFVNLHPDDFQLISRSALKTAEMHCRKTHPNGLIPFSSLRAIPLLNGLWYFLNIDIFSSG
jgi:hypothetical protein